LSRDLQNQKQFVDSAFQAEHYAAGKRFLETDLLVGELKGLVSEIATQNVGLKEAEVHKAISQLSRQVACVCTF
jgi:hypothetical protein